MNNPKSLKRLNELERLKVGKHWIHIRESSPASNQSVIFVHGIGVSGAYFLPLAEIMAKNYHVVVIDLPGYGNTPRPKRPLDIAELSGTVAELIKLKSLDRPLLVGHSMGCQIIARLCDQQPGLAGGRVLIGPTVNKAERGLFWHAARLAQDSFREPLNANRVIFRDYLRMGPRFYLTTCRYMLRDKIENNLSLADVPTLIIRGEKDVIVSHEWTEYLRSRVTSSQLTEVPQAAHAAHCTHPDKVARLISEFFASRPPAQLQGSVPQSPHL